VPPLGGISWRHGMDLHPTLPPKGGTTNRFSKETEDMNVFEGLKRSRTFLREENALWFENGYLTYDSLYHQTLRIAHALKKEGVGRGDKVCLFLPTVPEFVMRCYAATSIGGVVVSINVMNKRDEVSYIVNDCDAKALITSEEILDQIPDKGEAGKLQIIYSCGKSDLC